MPGGLELERHQESEETAGILIFLEGIKSEEPVNLLKNKKTKLRENFLCIVRII